MRNSKLTPVPVAPRANALRTGQEASEELAEALNRIGMFFRKPVSMRAGTFGTPVKAWEWLSAELAENPPPETALPVEKFLEQARDCLNRAADAYVGYYTAQGARFLVRALLVCPREGERCPGLSR